MQTQKIRKSLTYKVYFGKFTNNSYFGVTNHKNKFIVINTEKSKRMQIYTLLHERIHEIIEKIFVKRIGVPKTEFLHGIHDLIDYFVSDFQNTYDEFIRYNGFKWYVRKVAFRYLSAEKDIYDIHNFKKNLSLEKAKFYLIAILKREGKTEIEIAEVLK